MNRRSKIIIGSFFLCVIMTVLFFYTRYLEDKKYESIGGKLISEIEKYRNETGRLPDSVIDLGIVGEMGQGPYYEKKDSLTYIVYFNIGFDEIRIYCSNTKEWRDKP